MLRSKKPLGLYFLSTGSWWNQEKMTSDSKVSEGPILWIHEIQMACELGRHCHTLTVTLLQSRPLFQVMTLHQKSFREVFGLGAPITSSLCAHMMQHSKGQGNQNASSILSHQWGFSENWKTGLFSVAKTTLTAPKQLLQSFLWDLTKIPRDLRHQLPDC